MPKVRVVYLGRMVAVYPFAVGLQFAENCTVHRLEREEACAENKWQSKMVEDTRVLWWEDTHPDTKEDCFVTYAGYGYRIESALRAQGHDVEVSDLVPTRLPTTPAEIDMEQFAKIEWRGSQRAVFCRLLANRCGSIDCPTGWGKSFLIRQLALAYPKAKIVVTVPSSDVANEIFKELVVFIPSEVGFAGDGKRMKRRIMVAITHSLGHCDREADLILVDEAHAVLTPNFVDVFQQFHRARMFAFTATPDGRSDKGDGYLEALFGPIIFKVPYQEAVETGNVAPIRYRVYQCPQGPDVSRIRQKALKDRIGIWRNPQRNLLIANVVRSIENEFGPDAQILIMASSTEHCYVLQQLLPDYTVVTGEVDAYTKDKDTGELVDTPKFADWKANGVFAEGQVLCTKQDRAKHKEAFTEGKLKRCIATHVWSKGVNFFDLKVLVRVEGLGAAIPSGQVPGRLSRLGKNKDKDFGLLVDFNDSFSRDLAQRSAERFKVYAKNGWTYEPGIL